MTKSRASAHALRLPGAGTTVGWTWIFSGNPNQLGTLDEARDGLSRQVGH